MKIASLRRYPVKSMLGEDLTSLTLDVRGVVGDRALALVDAEHGRVATAKQPRYWRALLRCHSAGSGTAVRVTLPDGRSLPASGPGTLAGREAGPRLARLPGSRPRRQGPSDVGHPDPPRPGLSARDREQG